jgi:Uma2 family endonuclease
MATRPQARLITLEEYFAFENASPARHEFVDGEVYAVSGVSRRHGQIVGNVFMVIGPAARRAGCRVHVTDLKLLTPRAVYYPDVIVGCESPPANEYVEDAPCFVVEVLSPSTEHIDRREKRVAYQGLASVQSYLIVDQERRFVEWYARGDDGGWMHARVVEQGEIVLVWPGVTLTLDEIYEGVELPPADARRVREDEPAYG